MRTVILSIVLATGVGAAAIAQDADPEEGPSLMERGADLFLEGLIDEMGPALEGMRQFAEEMGPALQELMTRVENWAEYEKPEMLPNGDIIIRRKTPLDPENRPEAAPDDDPVEDPLEKPSIEL
ncbi:hypothetical protein R5H30_16315 [Sulfitobacter sp. D35]|uniref:hypothetical protein n=1 Tax=Sulfitobacter sp. D35 TaxID=3083252 RepID=UPI00296ED4CE|nr:hypothetical protein [Sulfitobacter sp. D35]MDW4499559.1 hypothetical protein [Sulfitobacter sp. D35]